MQYIETAHLALRVALHSSVEKRICRKSGGPVLLLADAKSVPGGEEWTSLTHFVLIGIAPPEAKPGKAISVFTRAKSTASSASSVARPSQQLRGRPSTGCGPRLRRSASC